MITASRLAKGVVRTFLLLLVTLSVSQAAPTVSTVGVPSAAMNRNVTCSVMLPSSYATDSAAYPVVYMLHGSGNDNTTYSSAAEIQQLVETYGFIAVCPKDGTDWWLDAPNDPLIRYETFISSELVAYVDQNYRTVADRARRMIAGHSMGGHGAGFIGMRHKDVFGTVGIVIGGVDLTQDTARADLIRLLGPYADNETLWRNHSVVTEAAKLSDGDLNIYITVGVNDMFIAPNRTLHGVLTEAGVTHTYEEMTQDGYTTHTRATAYYGLGKAFAFAANAWGIEPSGGGGSAGSADATPENTYYLLGNDPAQASSITGIGMPVGWTNALGVAAKKVVADGHYVVDGKYTPVGKIGSLRTPETGICTFGGASLTLNNGSQLAVRGSNVTVPRLYVKEGEGLLSTSIQNGETKFDGGFQVLAGGRLVFNRRTANDARTTSVQADLSGSGEVVVANSANASGWISFGGDNSGLVGSVTLEAQGAGSQIRFASPESWFGNPSVPGAAVVDLTANSCYLDFLQPMELATPNRVIDLGAYASRFRSETSSDGTHVTIASPIRGTGGVYFSRTISGSTKSVFVLTGDNSGLSGTMFVSTGTTLVISNAQAAASAVPCLNGVASAPAVLEIDMDAVGDSGAVFAGYPSGQDWVLSLRSVRAALSKNKAVMRIRNATAADYGVTRCLYNGTEFLSHWTVAQDGDDVLVRVKRQDSIPETAYYLTEDRKTVNADAEWKQRCENPQTVTTLTSAHSAVVDGDYIIKTPQTAGTFPGRVLYLAGGNLFPSAGQKQLYTIDHLYFSGSENNRIRVAANGGVVLGGADWTLMDATSVVRLDSGASGTVRPMEIRANFHSGGQGGTILCLDVGGAVQANTLTLSGDNSDFFGRLICDYIVAGSRTIVKYAKSWPSDPEEPMSDGLVLRQNATLSFSESVVSGPTRGICLGENTTIDVATGQTVVFEGPLVAQNGFVKTGEGTLVIKNCALLRKLKRNVRIIGGSIVWPKPKGLVLTVQ